MNTSGLKQVSLIKPKKARSSKKRWQVVTHPLLQLTLHPGRDLLLSPGLSVAGVGRVVTNSGSPVLGQPEQRLGRKDSTKHRLADRRCSKVGQKWSSWWINKSVLKTWADNKMLGASTSRQVRFSFRDVTKITFAQYQSIGSLRCKCKIMINFNF